MSPPSSSNHDRTQTATSAGVGALGGAAAAYAVSEAQAAALEALVNSQLEAFRAELESRYADLNGQIEARLAEVGQLSALRADIGKQKAMEWLTDNVALVDDNGEPIDRDALEFPAAADEEESPTTEPVPDEEE